MNFFEAQDSARRKTWQLALMFGAAVVTLVVLTNILVGFVFGFARTQVGVPADQTLDGTSAGTWALITIGVLGVITVASLYKYLTIRGGGRVIAEAMGGSLVHQNTSDLKQRQLLNVVEEMAIAAGTPVPPVYLIPEPSINAFAAGFGVDDAVIGINQGTLDHLRRDELQGVIGHEFSHILNGDTNINLRLIAILHGILFIGIIGYGLLRAGGHSRRNGAPILALGAGLMAIGYGGTFFGNMIKSAVSRQREYLADASAVQFTRDPSGIADALKKIGGLSYGSTMKTRAAEEASHMLFGAGSRRLTALFATHPPLDKRIRAIQPNWDGAFPHVDEQARTPVAVAAAGVAGFAGTGTTVDSADALVAQVGAPDAHSLASAVSLIAASPEPLKSAAHDPFEARALIYAMLLPTDAAGAAVQLDFIRRAAEPGVPPHVDRLREPVTHADPQQRVTLLEMAVPALKELSQPQYERFMHNVAQLITADRSVDLFEWVLYRLLVKELKPHFDGPQQHHGRIASIDRLADDAATLLSILASHTHADSDLQQSAYQAGARELGLTAAFVAQPQFDYERLNRALGNLRKLKPLAKPALIKACAATVTADGVVSPAEHALMRGIAATLDCPLPPSI